MKRKGIYLPINFMNQKYINYLNAPIQCIKNDDAPILYIDINYLEELKKCSHDLFNLFIWELYLRGGVLNVANGEKIFAESKNKFHVIIVEENLEVDAYKKVNYEKIGIYNLNKLFKIKYNTFYHKMIFENFSKLGLGLHKIQNLKEEFEKNGFEIKEQDIFSSENLDFSNEHIYSGKHPFIMNKEYVKLVKEILKENRIYEEIEYKYIEKSWIWLLLSGLRTKKLEFLKDEKNIRFNIKWVCKRVYKKAYDVIERTDVLTFYTDKYIQENLKECTLKIEQIFFENKFEKLLVFFKEENIKFIGQINVVHLRYIFNEIFRRREEKYDFLQRVTSERFFEILEELINNSALKARKEKVNKIEKSKLEENRYKKELKVEGEYREQSSIKKEKEPSNERNIFKNNQKNIEDKKEITIKQNKVPFKEYGTLYSVLVRIDYSIEKSYILINDKGLSTKRRNGSELSIHEPGLGWNLYQALRKGKTSFYLPPNHYEILKVNDLRKEEPVIKEISNEKGYKKIFRVLLTSIEYGKEVWFITDLEDEKKAVEKSVHDKEISYKIHFLAKSIIRNYYLGLKKFECNKIEYRILEFKLLMGTSIDRIYKEVMNEALKYEESFTKKENSNKGNFSELEAQSELKKAGYNVRQGGPSAFERRKVLENFIRSKKMRKYEIINFLEWNINMKSGSKFIRAREKWKSDIDYINKNF